jgi:hypothetical protein
MCAVPAAAGGKACVFACSENGSQGTDPKDQREEDGQRTLHLHMMLYEVRIHEPARRVKSRSGIINALHL